MPLLFVDMYAFLFERFWSKYNSTYTYYSLTAQNSDLANEVY